MKIWAQRSSVSKIILQSPSSPDLSRDIIFVVTSGQLCGELCWGTHVNIISPFLARKSLYLLVPTVTQPIPQCRHLSAQPHQPSCGSLNSTCYSQTLADVVLSAWDNLLCPVATPHVYFTSPTCFTCSGLNSVPLNSCAPGASVVTFLGNRIFADLI